MQVPELPGFFLEGFDPEPLETREGGFCYVIKARRTDTQRCSALKVLRPPYNHHPAFVDRVHREIEVLGRLEHPGIVRLLDYHCTVSAEPHAWHYLEMEWLEGPTLLEVLTEHRARGRPMSAADIRAILVPLCDALQYAHTCAEEPIIHRDLKPNNVILLDGDLSRPVLMDFGIVHIQSGRKLTEQWGFGVATVEYMSPEHASKGGIDGRADLYSLGVLLYEMATGEVPFPNVHGNPVQVLASHIQQRPIPPRRLRPDLPEWLEYVILRLLQKRREDRFGSAAEVASIAAAEAALEQAPSVSDGVDTSQFEDMELRHALREQRQRMPTAALVRAPSVPTHVRLAAWLVFSLLLLAGVVSLIYVLFRADLTLEKEKGPRERIKPPTNGVEIKRGTPAFERALEQHDCEYSTDLDKAITGLEHSTPMPSVHQALAVASELAKRGRNTIAQNPPTAESLTRAMVLFEEAARLYEAAGKPDEAKKMRKEASGLQKKLGEDMARRKKLRLASSLEQVGREVAARAPAAAIEIFRRAADAYDKGGDKKKAESVLEKIPPRPPTPIPPPMPIDQVLRKEIKWVYGKGGYEGARAAWRVLSEKWFPIWQVLVDTKERSWSEALDEYRTILDTYEDINKHYREPAQDLLRLLDQKKKSESSKSSS